MSASRGRKDEQARVVARRLILPVALILAVSAVLFCGLIWYAARNLDDVALESSAQVMQSKLTELQRRIAVDAKDRAWWDEAQRKLFEQRDTIWAEDNFGGYAHDSLGWSSVFVLGPDGAPGYSWIEGKSFGRARNPHEFYGDGLASLIEAASRSSMEEPDPVAGLLADRDGVVHIVGVSPFTWEVPTVAQLASAPRPMLVISFALDDAALAGIAEELNVRGLRIAHDDGQAREAVALNLIAPDGSSSGILAWNLDLPGERLTTTVLPVVIAAFLVMSWLLWLVFDRANRAARRIENGARLLAAQNSALERSEQRVRAIMDNVADGIFSVNPEGGIESVNPAALRLFGYDTQTIMEKGFLSLIDCPQGFQVLAAFRAGDDVPAQIQGAVGRRADGSTFPIDLSAGEVTISDRRLLTVVVRDMTERERQAEALSGARDAAEQANRAKSDFLAHISHELRTPLNAVIGFSEMYTSKIFGALGDKRYDEYATHIHDSGKHLLALINDILDLSRADANRLELYDEDVALDEVIGASVEMVRKELGDAGLALDVDIQDDLPRLRADERRLRQVAINLLSNAVKFTPRGGRITVRAGIDGERRIRMTVRDTGIGMRQEDVEKAFIPFTQVDTTLTRRHLGAGIGLSLTRRLVEAHGAEIAIVSAPGKGTTVTVVFPSDRTVDATSRLAAG
ncbi:MAG: PAS domain S-box protein [Rhodospirillaceae bacterium]|nr:PAS domain S-box protein [Rhodospirillaceae bacterium]MBT6117209.1 PAS domain S-box protein [Rhodospirillaceae bacterium]